MSTWLNSVYAKNCNAIKVYKRNAHKSFVVNCLFYFCYIFQVKAEGGIDDIFKEVQKYMDSKNGSVTEYYYTRTP